MSFTENAAQSAVLAFRRIRPTLLIRARDPKAIPNEIEQISGFAWERGLVVAVGGSPINNFAHCIKAARIAMEKSMNFANFPAGPSLAPPQSFLSAGESGVPSLANSSFTRSFPLPVGWAS